VLAFLSATVKLKLDGIILLLQMRCFAERSASRFIKQCISYIFKSPHGPTVPIMQQKIVNLALVFGVFLPILKPTSPLDKTTHIEEFTCLL
jgi:hypothetical protein